MTAKPAVKTIQEINDRIRSGDVVVVTADEMTEIVKENGPEAAAREVDVVTTGTFAPMCSSGAMINIGQSIPTIKASGSVFFNNVPAYGDLAAVDCYLGATALSESDPLNKVYPGEFSYGGGHVIEDLVRGKNIHLRANGYGTTCYPNRNVEKEMTLAELPQATLCNPRNGYQNYNCAINMTDKTVYTYMGTLRPHAGNANYCSAGQLSPLFNDPKYRTIGLGTRIFLGGGEGYVVWHGTQHNPKVERTETGAPVTPAGTLFVMGDLKQMTPEWLRGVSIRGYGASMAVGLGVPIPILDVDMAICTGVSNDALYTHVIDYGSDYANGIKKNYGRVSYAELMSGSITLDGRSVPTVPLSSLVGARRIAATLKEWIAGGGFLLGEPQFTLPV